MVKGLYYAKRIGGNWHLYYNGKEYGIGRTPNWVLFTVLKHKNGLV